jgi:hypothetical protein
MDVLGLAYDEYFDAERDAVVNSSPRTPHFKEGIMGLKHKPETTLGNVKDEGPGRQGPTFPPREVLQRNPRVERARLTVATPMVDR